MAKNKQVRGTCTVPGCSRPHKARGYCNTHVQRFRRGVDITGPIATRDRHPPDRCTEAGCSETVKAKGLCQAHYARLLRHGHTRYPDRKRPPKPCTFLGCTNHLYAKELCHQHYMRGRKFKRLYGITMADYASILQLQDGVCAICGGPSTKLHNLSGKLTDFCVDHDHRTGKVRGLLCDNCNRAIGLLQDDPNILRRAAAYLERPPPA